MLNATAISTMDDAVDFFNEEITSKPIVPNTTTFKPVPYQFHLTSH
jgi:hypothetical protein